MGDRGEAPKGKGFRGYREGQDEDAHKLGGSLAESKSPLTRMQLSD